MTPAPEIRKAWLQAVEKTNQEVDRIVAGGGIVTEMEREAIFQRFFEESKALEDPHKNFPPNESP